MSLGFISTRYTTNTTSKISVQEDSNITVNSTDKKKNFAYKFLFVLLSLGGIGVVFFGGLNNIPHHILVNFDNYNSSSSLVLNAMFRRFVHEPLITLVAWLFPIPFAIFIPLSITEYPLKISSIVLSCIAWVSFLFYEERVNFIHTLNTLPEIGYMWYEVLVISLSAFFALPYAFWLIWGGPMVAVCAGPYSPQKSTWINIPIYTIFAVSSIVFVLPTVDRFVNESREFFLLGYTSDSLVANILSIGMIHVWVRTYHIVCRDCYNTFRQTKRFFPRMCAIFYVLLNTALVEIWVCSAYALHFAYVSAFQINEREDMIKRWVKKRVADNSKFFRCIFLNLS